MRFKSLVAVAMVASVATIAFSTASPAVTKNYSDIVDTANKIRVVTKLAKKQFNSNYLGLRYHHKTLPKGLDYLGGWIVDDPVNGREYTVTQIQKKTHHMLWLELIESRDKHGRVNVKVLDVINLSKLTPTDYLAPGNTCSLNGKQDPQLIALVKLKNKNENTEYFQNIKKAWITNTQTGKFQEILTNNIICTNPGLGV
jgi:hypothetical protein